MGMNGRERHRLMMMLQDAQLRQGYDELNHENQMQSHKLYRKSQIEVGENRFSGDGKRWL